VKNQHTGHIANNNHFAAYLAQLVKTANLGFWRMP